MRRALRSWPRAVCVPALAPSRYPDGDVDPGKRADVVQVDVAVAGDVMGRLIDAGAALAGTIIAKVRPS